ncbi:MAG: hypothetical protein ABIH11_01795 [Candidatus Altiarchaeota archaeon]
MNGFRRGQASLEYMIMLALSLAVFSAILYVTSTLISTSSAQVGVDSAYRAVEKLRDASDFIYVHGHPSRTQVNIYIPPNVEEASILNNNTFNVRVGIGPSYTDIYSVSKGRVYGDLSGLVREGYYVFRVESLSDTEINVTQI